MSGTHSRLKMPTRTISITEEAYDRLKVRKEKNESFSDVINKITGKKSIMELAGILSKEQAEKLEKHIRDRRKASREHTDKIRESLK